MSSYQARNHTENTIESGQNMGPLRCGNYEVECCPCFVLSVSVCKYLSWLFLSHFSQNCLPSFHYQVLPGPGTARSFPPRYNRLTTSRPCLNQWTGQVLAGRKQQRNIWPESETDFLYFNRMKGWLAGPGLSYQRNRQWRERGRGGGREVHLHLMEMF